MRKSVLLAIGAFVGIGAMARAQSPALLNVDASEVTRYVIHVRETIPVKAGKLALAYPKWIPGEHAPTGPINGVVNLKLTAGGKPLEWRRDDVEMFVVRCEVPAGADSIEADFDYEFEPRTIATPNLARIKWNRLVLYPSGTSGDNFRVQASLLLPSGWKYGTALPAAFASSDSVSFAPVSLHKLIDSPVLAGRWFKVIPLASGVTPPHEIDLATETEAGLDMKPELRDGYARLVTEAGALFGARHYSSYRWLLSLSDQGGYDGLEHHESSEDGVGEKAYTEKAARLDLADLLAHEYSHSWNGKYRRPAGLATPDYETPMKGELLWVYEGLTEYLGTILPPRAGLWTPEEFRDILASTAAYMDGSPGRNWRPLVDTAVSVQRLSSERNVWLSDRRGLDYYPEGLLIWLEADTIIRQKTNGQKSLDDFCRAFHGGQNTLPMLKTYTFDDVVSALNSVTPYDWAKFLRDRVYAVQSRAPLGGIENGGWKLVYNDTPNDVENKYNGWQYSIGLRIEDGKIIDVIAGQPAAKAGMAPGMNLVAINGRKYTSDVLKAAIKATSSGGKLELLVEDSDLYKTFTLDYKGGERFPHLERDATKPDLLSAIIAAKAK